VSGHDAFFALHPEEQLSAQDGAGEAGQVRLNEEDVAYLMNLLRNATQPVTTQQLIDALRRQSAQSRDASDAVAEREPTG
jgi:hypothetical protein